MALASSLRRLRAEIGEALGLHARALAGIESGAALVLTYHRVLPPEEAAARHAEPGMVVSPATFRRHCAWLAGAMRVLPLAELVERAVVGRALPPRACALTFDDGWRDNHDHAWPVLREMELPATIFLVTGRVGSAGAFWPDDVVRRLAPLRGAARAEHLRRAGLPAQGSVSEVLALLKRLPEAMQQRAVERLRAETPAPPPAERELLDWKEVARMAEAGIAFESHGHGHRLLTRIPAHEVRRDLVRAREALRARGYGRAHLLAYPGGEHDGTVRRLAGSCGVRAAFTTRLGAVRCGDPPLALARVGVHEDVSGSRAELRRRLAQAARSLPAHEDVPPAASPRAMRSAATTPPSR